MEIGLKSEDEMRKYFISLALNYKFKFADKIKEDFSIEGLYEKIKKLSVPISDWQMFIQKELRLI